MQAYCVFSDQRILVFTIRARFAVLHLFKVVGLKANGPVGISTGSTVLPNEGLRESVGNKDTFKFPLRKR